MPFIQKTVLVLESPKDWDNWYEIVRRTARVLGISHLVDITAVSAPRQLLKPQQPSYRDVKPLATSYTELDAVQKDAYKVLQTDYRMAISRFDEEAAVRDLIYHIQETTALGLQTYIRGLDAPYDILQALKKRMAPTDMTRRVELARELQALKRAPKSQSLDSWLQLWETKFAEAERLNLAETQDNKALYNFIAAIMSVGAAYATSFQISIDREQQKGCTSIPTLYEAIELFRNFLRHKRANSKAQHSHTAFATLQGEEANSTTSADSAETTTTRPEAKKRGNCLCGEKHYFSQCPYLNVQNRPKGWSPNDQIRSEINEKLAKNPGLKKIVEQKQRRAAEQAKQRQNSPSDAPNDTTEQQPSSVAALTSFALDADSFELRDTWILDSGANSHVCNNAKRFKFERMAMEGEQLVAGKSVYPIEAFGSVTVTIKSPNGPAQIQLLDVALVPGFFTNIASLHRFTAKGVHWDTQQQRLHVNGETFCHIERVGSHWALEHNPSPQTAENGSILSFATSKDPRKAIEATSERWHAILGHPGDEAIEHLQQNALGAVVTAPAPGTPTPCEPCALGRAHKIISRRSEQSEPATEPLQRVAYDLIPMDIGYNGDKWVSHFYCFVTGMDFVYTPRKKSDAFDVIEEFLEMVKTRYNLSVPNHDCLPNHYHKHRTRGR